MRLGVAARGQIELVGLVDQLCDAFSGLGLKRQQTDLHLQRLQKLTDIPGAFEQFRAMRVAPVLVSTRQIVGGKCHGLEIPGHQHSARKGRRVGAQLGHSHLGQGPAHLGSLNRVVVQEHQRIRPDVKAPGDVLQVRSLVLPVGNKNSDVVLLEQHARVFTERQSGCGVIVLGAHGKHNSAPTQIQGH